MISSLLSFFFFNDTATTEIYTLSLHDALPISWSRASANRAAWACCRPCLAPGGGCGCAARDCVPCWCWPAWRCLPWQAHRSEEHTSELQSHLNLVCRLLLEKKNSTSMQSMWRE